MIACESSNISGTFWTWMISGMNIYTGKDIKERLKKVGFDRVWIKQTNRG